MDGDYMATPRRRGAPPLGERLTRQVVVDRARDLIAALGRAAFSIRTLAADLGVRPAALYNHVRDRDDLLDAVADQFAATFVLPEPGGDWPQWVAAVARRLRRHMVEHPHLTDVVLAQRTAGPARPAVLREFMRHLVDAGVEAATAHVAWHAMIDLVLGALRQERAGVDHGEVFDLTLDILLAGLRSAAQRPADRRATELLRAHGLG